MSWDGSSNVPKCQKDVKLSKRCQMSKNQTPRLWRRFTKKFNWHNEVHRYWCQFWRHKWWSLKTLKMLIESNFGAILMTFISDIKFDINICEPQYVNIFFLWTSSIVQIFNIWHLFWQLGILTHNLNHLSLSQGYFYGIQKERILELKEVLF